MNVLERRYVERLERRRSWLLERVEGYRGKSPSHDQAEIAALTWALRVIRHADEHGILQDLASVTR